jgi:hypothetical protein
LGQVARAEDAVRALIIQLGQDMTELQAFKQDVVNKEDNHSVNNMQELILYFLKCQTF